MKIGTILFIVIFVFASLICLAHNQEGFVSTQPIPEDKKAILETIPELEGTLKKISEFTYGVGSVDKNKISSEELNAISEKLSNQVNEVGAKLNLLIAKLNQDNDEKIRNIQTIPSENLVDSADVKASQIIQDERIKTLKDRLAKLQHNFGNYIQTKNEKNYPKIPVYSSCVISEAGGTYSLDPEKIQGQRKDITTKLQGDKNVVPSVAINNPLKNITTPQTTGSDSVVMIEQILEGLSKKDVQINFNIPENK
jgi:hypothetical protein